MKIYRILHGLDSSDELRYRVSGRALEAWDALDGQLASARWRPPAVSFVKGRRRSHFPAIGFGGLVALQSAWEKLRPVLEGQVEALPLPVEGTDKTYVVLHILSILDCLDYDRSKLLRFSDGTYMFGTGTYRFKPHCIGDINIFRLRETANAEAFVTDRFREAVEANRLKGLWFDVNSPVDDVDL